MKNKQTEYDKRLMQVVEEKYPQANFRAFARDAKKICPGRVYESYLLRYAYGIDASCYSYVPRIVVKPHNEGEVVQLIDLARRFKTPYSFRAAGSSLSGQSCAEGVLIVANDGFKYHEIIDNGEAIRLSCGVIGSDANEYLKPYGKKIGPDPATIATALVGGIVNNNSSGMCCGTAQNSYKTIRSLRVVLRDGFVLDTGDPKSVERFLLEKPNIVEGLLNIRKDIMADAELRDLIERKFKIKNTTGYSLNAFVDFEEVIDILNHVFVGSEGTLGFVSEVVYNCVDDAPYKGCGLLFFETLDEASRAVVALANMGREVVVAAEMMDYLTLKAVQKLDSVPDFVRGVKPGTSCILFQSEAEDEETLDKNLAFIEKELAHLKTAMPSLYSKDPKDYNSWWMIRKGALPIVAGLRRSGTTVITEDVCFKIEQFCDGIAMITELFEKYGFTENGVIFGHALSGNVHFVITPDFNVQAECDAFTGLVEEMAKRVAAVEGSVKAEHGTGRMVAPFVEVEWGKKAYEINRRIKAIFDEDRLINPDVIITDDPDIFKKNLKSQTPIDPLFNMCMECGFCEKNCPSRNLTLTPRQRIGLLREETRLRKEGHVDLADLIKDGYEYYGQATCAACSMCKNLCPLEIDTAQIALSMRRLNAKGGSIAKLVYNNFGKTLKAARVGVTLGGVAQKVVGKKNIASLSEAIHKKIDIFPYMPTTMPKANTYALEDRQNYVGQAGVGEHSLQGPIADTNFGEKRTIVYFSTCANRAFKPNQGLKDTRSVQQVFENICAKAKVNIKYPADIHDLCCGLSFETWESVDEKALADLQRAFSEASENGQYPVVVDHSACFSHALKHIKGVTILDMAEFLANILDDLTITKTNDVIMVHKQCKIKSAGRGGYIEAVAKACSDAVYNMDSLACCGFAGQKGFFTPELNDAATKDLRAECREKGVTLGVSSSSTCEIGLGEKSGVPFVNICYLLDRCAQEKA